MSARGNRMADRGPAGAYTTKKGRREPAFEIWWDLTGLLIHHLLGLDAQSGMRDGSQPGLIDQFASYPANSVSLILDAHDGFFEVIYERDLAAGHLAQLLSFHAHATIFHGHVPGVIIISSHLILARDQPLQVSQFFFGCVQFAIDQFSEFSQFCVAVSHSGSCLFFLWCI